MKQIRGMDAETFMMPGIDPISDCFFQLIKEMSHVFFNPFVDFLTSKDTK